MARPKKDARIDLSRAHDLSAGLIERLACPADKEQVFLRAASVDGLRVRCTRTQAKAWVFESKVNGKTFRRTLGPVGVLTIPQAEEQARALALVVKNQKADPRELERKQAEAAALAAEVAKVEALRQQQEEAARSITVGAVWTVYMAERKAHWRERTYAEHVDAVHPGGQPRKRSKELTKPGPLLPLMSLRLVDLKPEVVHEWAKVEAATRPARVRLGLRMLKAFVRWAAQSSSYQGLADPQAASSKKAREVAGKPSSRHDVLQREQLPAWFAAVSAIPNRSISAYLQTLLLTGGRREELMALRWEDVNFQWGSLHIADKVEDEGRVVPLTPYVAALLQALPRRNEWVFSSVRAIGSNEKLARRRSRYHEARGQQAPMGDVAVASASGRITNPEKAHKRACAVAGIEGLTFHGLRRSFASLSEWVECPEGVAAQIQGHKPSGTREKHYIRRPLDLLRLHHTRIEKFIIEQAGLVQPKSTGAGLKVVA